MRGPQAVPSETAAVLIEPVLGEGGYVVPSAAYMGALRAFCDKHNLLLIADEVVYHLSNLLQAFSLNQQDHNSIP